MARIERTSFKVANIIEEAKIGGPQIYLLTVAQFLKGQADTTIILPKKNSYEFCKKCQAIGISFQTFPIVTLTRKLGSVLRYIIQFPWEIYILYRYFKQHQFYLIHVSGGSWQYKGVIAGKISGTKVIWHLNDSSMPRIFRIFFSWLSPFADAFIHASVRTKKYYQPYLRKSVPEFVIPAPVDTRYFDPKLDIKGDEELINQWKDKMVIGTVANISPVKGLETLIETAALLNQQFDNLVFIIIGQIYDSQNQYFENLKKNVSSYNINNLHWVGNRYDIRPLINRFDIHCCSSLSESSPVSVWEAMSMEKPIVSTDVGDVPLYVRHDQNGFIVPVKNAERLAQGVSTVLKDANLRKVFGERSHLIAQVELDAKLCAERHLMAYQKIIYKNK